MEFINEKKKKKRLNSPLGSENENHVQSLTYYSDSFSDRSGHLSTRSRESFANIKKMAIFGKKKEKNTPGGQDGSPTLDNQQSQAGSQMRSGPMSPQSNPGHGSKGSISGGMGQQGNGMYGSVGPNSNLNGASHIPGPGPSILRGPNQPQGPYNGPPSVNNGPPPGAAGGFKFGGPPRQDLGNSGIPAPGSSQMRGGPASGEGQAINNTSYNNMAPVQSSNAAAPGVGAGNVNGISGLPPSSTGAPPIQGGTVGSGGERPRTQQVVYPWSQRSLSMNPPRFLDEARQAAAVGAVSPSPFPRYGHAANSAASSTGEIYLFGGLVRESVKNDLYVVYVDKVTQPAAPLPPGSPPGSLNPAGGVNATLVQTTGEIPPPRVGHATVLVANVLILWGGDTKVRADDKQDEGLYLLNLSTREWTRVRPANEGPNAGPVGRYGHTVSIVGSRFYVFGGQVDGTFMNDIWSFDLNSLKTTPTWELLKPSTELPPKRTGHASVTYKDKIFIFGGTDGQYHYNDTWCYDVASNAWRELSCIGYIPVPREGHAACLVDDVMYIFGGRGVDGKDLGDLASFRISNQRWYMFANMGPSPSGRSGHALTAFQNKVVVLGGESFTGAKPDDPSIVYVLDTAKIKYPPEQGSKGATASQQQQQRKPGATDAGSRSMSPADRAMSPSQRGAPPPASLAAITQPPDGTTQSAIQAPPPGGPSLPPQQSNGQATVTQSEIQSGQKNVRGNEVPSAMAGIGAAPALSMSPTQRNAQSPIVNVSQNVNATSPPPQMRQGSLPLGNAPPMSYNGPRSQRSIENMRNGTGAVSPIQRGLPNGINNTDRTMSPTPADGFHYSSMPNGKTPQQTTGGAPGEVENLRKREAWMKAALAMAVKKGFVAPEDLDQVEANGATGIGAKSPDLNLQDIDTGAPGSEKDKIVRALISLKAQLAQAKSTIAQQAQSEADRIGESDRARLAALSEAAFYRAKLDALESGNTSEAERVQRERTNDIERQLSDTLRETGEFERQLIRLREELKLEQQLRSSAEDRLSEATKRAMSAEAAQLKVYDELANIQKKSHTQETQLRDHREKVVTLTALVAKHQSDHDEARSQLDDHRSTSENQSRALRDLQASLAAATARAGEHERLHQQHRDLASQHESTIARLRSELQSKTTESDGHQSRAVELESLVSHHRSEAESHRQAVTGGLAQILSFQKQQGTRSADQGIPSHVNDRIRALQDECDSMRQVHAESKQAADQAHSLLDEMRERNFSLEKQQSGLRSELSAMRSQLTIALQEVARLKDVSSSRDLEIRDSKRHAEATQVKHALLRQFMTDRGVSVPGDDELHSKVGGGVSDKRIRELEEEVDSQSRELAETEHRLRDASSRVEELTRELEHVSTRAARASASAPQVEEAQRRATLAERELEDAHTTYRDRAAQLEQDYQTAVQFVKGSEKMLRRMKDELTKYKSENSSLQDELMNARSGMYSPDNEAAKDVEALRIRLAELTQKHDDSTIENRELERKMAALIAEHKDFRDKNKELLEAGPGGATATQNAKVQELETQIASLEASLTDVRRELQESLSLNTHLSSELNSASKGVEAGAGGANGSTNANAMARNLNAAQVQNEQLRNERDSLAQKLQETEDKLQLLLSNDSEVGGEAATRDSHAFSITSELDKWERDRAGVPDTLPPGVSPAALATSSSSHAVPEQIA